MKKSLEVILAATPNGEIGYKNTLPWRLKGDLKRFKELTMGQTLIMGRNTYESLPAALPGRSIVVVSGTLVNQARADFGLKKLDWSTLSSALDGVVYAVRDLGHALRLAQNTQGNRVFVAGGARLYSEALQMHQDVDFIHHTLVYKQSEHGYDAVIPDFNLRDYVSCVTPEVVFEDNPLTGLREVSHAYCTYSSRQRSGIDS